MRTINIAIDPIKLCPLRCISCPRGRREIPTSSELLTVEQLEKILVRVSSQAKIHNVGLFNWGDPLFHPGLPDLVRLAKRFGKVFISTSPTKLGYKCDIPDLVKSEPDAFVVATSGWYQETHKTTHEGGDIDATRDFLYRLYTLGAKNVTVTFHRYNNNLAEEAKMRAYAKGMGFRFRAPWATHMPIEDLMAGVGNPYLVVPVKEQLAIAARSPQTDCMFITTDFEIQHNGDVRSCAVSRDQTMAGNVFEHTIEELVERKRALPLCTKCFPTRAHQVACSMNIGVDREAARRSKGNQLRYAGERFKKRFWKITEHRNQETIHER